MEGRLNSISDLEALRESLIHGRDPSKPCVTLCGGTGCLASGAREVADAFAQELKSQKIDGQVEFRESGCHGFCERGPLIVIRPKNLFYQRIQPKDVPEIVTKTLKEEEIIDRFLYVDPTTNEKLIYENEVPFYKLQKRLVFGSNGEIDPTSIEDYLCIGGYAALAKALKQMSPEEIIEEVKASGLRGRGGGGFPAGVKWESCRKAPGNSRYIICNADEGDPGAYMDRSLLEGNPHSVLEGMIIGAYAIGSHQGYIYVRHEYPLAVTNARKAIDQAEAYGLLGKNILGTGFDFSIKINRGGGAFVCGESTALMASLEGKIGEPRAKYIHTVERGLHDLPSNLNNVETWANVPLIINRGAAEYAQIGTEGSKGTKIFSLVGKINNTGLVEVPMGMTLREIIFDIGGGIPEGKRFKAVQTGGPSGGCLPESMLDLPIDFDQLTEAGSMMGSGGMIVMDEDTCMVDVAKYFVNFLQEESCGKCVPCREGIKRMLEILIRITEGKGEEGDIALLEELAFVLTEGSLCALGSTAANPVLSTVRYFREEYETHIRDKKCPAGICSELVEYAIDPEACTGCVRCTKACPVEAITGERKQVHVLNKEVCVKCGSCYEVCKFGAVIRS